MNAETKTVIDGRVVELINQGHGLKFYTFEDTGTVYIVNSKGNVLFSLEVECSQNVGFISEINVIE